MLERLTIEPAFHGFAHIPSIGWSHYRKARGRLDDHLHTDSYEFCYLEKGRQIFATRDRLYDLRGGQIFLTLPNEVHSTNGNPMEKSILYWMQFRFPKGKSFLRFGVEESRDYASRFAKLNLHKRIFESGAELPIHLRECFAAYASKEKIRLVVFRNHLELFFVKLLDLLEDETRKKGSYPGSRLSLKPILDWIEGRLTEKVSVPEAAERAGLSESHFKARFRKETGIPPAEYILRRKIEKAKEVLARQKDEGRITELAHALGFSSSQYFATAFRRIAGVSPRDWI